MVPAFLASFSARFKAYLLAAMAFLALLAGFFFQRGRARLEAERRQRAEAEAAAERLARAVRDRMSEAAMNAPRGQREVASRLRNGGF